MRLAGKHIGRLAAALLSACAGCSLELPSVCGDGLIDDDTELCDPAIDDGPPCDPATCTLIVEPACGNGKLDPGEPCDGGQYASMQNCPSGKGYLQCTADCQLDGSMCNRCGDGNLDTEEECDPNFPIDSFTQPVQCADLKSFPYGPYTSGQVTYCVKDTCKWYRGPCGYCGNDEVDPPRLIEPDVSEDRTIREVCDGRDVDVTDLRAYCQEQQGCDAEGSLCAFTCNATCEGFEPMQEQKCCLEAHSSCPTKTDPLPCCAAYEMGLDDLYAPEACQIFKTGMFQKSVCR
jgi:hypothetical protein